MSSLSIPSRFVRGRCEPVTPMTKALPPMPIRPAGETVMRKNGATVLPPPKRAAALEDESKYMRAKEIAIRWGGVSEATVHRVARKHKFRRFLPGEGRNGTVLYLTEDVLAHEASRTCVA